MGVSQLPARPCHVLRAERWQGTKTLIKRKPPLIKMFILSQFSEVSPKGSAMLESLDKWEYFEGEKNNSTPFVSLNFTPWLSCLCTQRMHIHVQEWVVMLGARTGTR